LGRRLTALLIDDTDSILETMRLSLSREEADVVAASNSEEAWQLIEGGLLPDIIFCDFRLPAEDGVSFLQRVTQRLPDSQRVLISAFAEIGVVERAINHGIIYRFLSKPWRAEDFQKVFESCKKEILRAEEQEQLVAERTQLLERIKKTWERTFDVVGSPLAIVGDDFTVKRANLAYADAAGADIREISERRCYELFFSRTTVCENCPVVVARETGTPARGQLVHEGHERVYHAAAYHFEFDGETNEEPRYVVMYDDVTERKKIERQLIQSEKMVALGTLSGEIAHEINNPVGIILSFSQLALRLERAAEDPEIHEFLTEIQKSARRCKSIVRNLLSFSRPSSVGSLQRVDLEDVIQKTLEIAAAQIRTQSVNVSLTMDPDLPVVFGYSDQLQQVILNLVTNAVHAMESVKKRRIDISVVSSSLEERKAVMIKLLDSGGGIPSDVISQVFEPFFTTKEEAKGTGLGLSVCYRIIRQHEGVIEVVNSEHAGAEFTILLPAQGDTQ